MYAIFEAFDSLNDFMSAGGMVLWLIAFLALFMWALILERIWYFNSGHKEFMKPLVKQWNGISDHSSWKASQIKDKLRSEAKEEINKHMSLIQTCVALAPLFGLLGTVTGMIEVFNAMAVQGGNARSMAAGVSMATIPTMSGMIASLSGMVGTTYLKRKVEFETRRFEDSLLLDH